MTPDRPDGDRSGLVIDGIDLSKPDLWDAYALGLQWGITYGLDMGRQELAAELMPVGTVIADLKLWTGTAYAERLRRRTAYTRPALAAEVSRARAEASWDSSPKSVPDRPDITGLRHSRMRTWPSAEPLQPGPGPC